MARIATSRGNSSGSRRRFPLLAPGAPVILNASIVASKDFAEWSVYSATKGGRPVARAHLVGRSQGAGHPHQCGQSRRYRHARLPADRSRRGPVGRLFRPDRRHRPHRAEWSAQRCRKGGRLPRLRRQSLHHRKRNLRGRRYCPDLTSPIEHPSSARRARTALCSSGPARGSVLRTAAPPRRSF